MCLLFWRNTNHCANGDTEAQRQEGAAPGCRASHSKAQARPWATGLWMHLAPKWGAAAGGGGFCRGPARTVNAARRPAGQKPQHPALCLCPQPTCAGPQAGVLSLRPRAAGQAWRPGELSIQQRETEATCRGSGTITAAVCAALPQVLQNLCHS